jgi:TRAP-type C4-dicarboxylate transport system permease small subunit
LILSIIDKLSLYAAWGAIVALLSITVLITIEVFIRKFFGISTKIAHDFAGYLLVAITFLGAAETMRVNKHLRVKILYDRLNSRAQSIFDKINYLIAIVYISILLWASFTLVVFSFKGGFLTESLIQIPEFIPELLIPIGLLFFALQVLSKLFSKFNRGDRS